MEKENKSCIYGLLFFMEINLLYLLDENGNICLVNENKSEININNIKINQVYKIENLQFIKKDDRNYFLYNIKEQTVFKSISDSSYFKKYAIIKFIFLDKIIDVKYPKIKVKDIEVSIKNKIQFASLFDDNDNSSYFLGKFELIINEQNNCFNIFIYKGEINSINCSLNGEGMTKNKCYEIIYLSKIKKYLPKELNVSGYIIKDFDKFSCTNRVRYNIMNIKKDTNFYKYDDNLSSYEIIYLIDEYNKVTKYGIFNVNSSKQIISKDFQIELHFSKFLQNFWNEYDQNNNSNDYNNNSYFNQQNSIFSKRFKDNNLNKFRSLKLLNIYNYTKKSLDNLDTFIFFRNYCFFIFLEYICKNSFYGECSKYFDLLKDINNYSFYNKIRILLQFINLIIEYGQAPKLININNLNEDHPYVLATKFQRNIITHLHEESNIFYPIVQFNSKILECLPESFWSYLTKILLNKKIRTKLAYTISLESINEMKTHLLNLEEDFFFVFDKINYFNFYGIYTSNTRIMTLNQYLLCKGVSLITDNTSKKNYAFKINMAFSHERMCHGKENLCNPGIESPVIYFNIKFQRDILYSESNNKNVGEAGRIFETFIGNPTLLKIMKENLLFGKYLDYHYFIGDFKEIKDEAFKIFRTTKYYNNLKNRKVKIYFFIFLITFIISCLFWKFYGLNLVLILLYSLSIIILSYKYYNIEDFIDIHSPCDNFDRLEGNNKDEDEPKFIFPDDYPMESDTFLGRNFPFLEFRKNKIRKKLQKYFKENEKY